MAKKSGTEVAFSNFEFQGSFFQENQYFPYGKTNGSAKFAKELNFKFFCRYSMVRKERYNVRHDVDMSDIDVEIKDNLNYFVKPHMFLILNMNDVMLI